MLEQEAIISTNCQRTILVCRGSGCLGSGEILECLQKRVLNSYLFIKPFIYKALRLILSNFFFNIDCFKGDK